MTFPTSAPKYEESPGCAEISYSLQMKKFLGKRVCYQQKE